MGQRRALAAALLLAAACTAKKSSKVRANVDGQQRIGLAIERSYVLYATARR